MSAFLFFIYLHDAQRDMNQYDTEESSKEKKGKTPGIMMIFKGQMKQRMNIDMVVTEI